jgi:Putative Flp pilus-assembly TadE/G-like
MRFAHTQRGQVLPIVALAAIVLLGMAGLAADVGYDRFQQRLQQTAADSAAIAGAAERVSGHAVSAAQRDASRNGYADNRAGTACNAADTCVIVNTPPSSGNYTTDSSAVEVLISKPYPRFFRRIFGSDPVKFTTRAVARMSSDNSGCVYLLDASQNTNFNEGSVSAPSCTVYINGTTNMNRATVSALKVFIGNLAGSNTGGTITPTPASLSLPVADPCSQIDGCAYLASNPPPTGGCGNLTVASGAVSPGCYSNLTINGPVTMLGGLYTITGSFNGGTGASVTGTGVTIYVASGASMNFNKMAVTLSAPVSGNYANVLIYQVPGNTSDANFNKTTSDLTGLVYMPSACPNWNKTGSGYTVIVFACANFNKGSETFGAPPTGGSIVKDAVLAE